MEVFRKPFALIAAFIAFVLTQGCTSDRSEEFTRSMSQINRVEAPAFLTPEVAAAFNNANFSAHLEVKRQPSDARSAFSGELFGRNGSLFFIASDPGKRQKVAGRLSALWDSPSQKAYLLNDPLQAYAPITNLAGKEIVVTRDAANFPQTIQLHSPELILQLSAAKMQAPPADFFALPDGFKAYPSTDALLTELMRRRTEAIDASMKLDRAKGERVLPEENSTMPRRRPGE